MHSRFCCLGGAALLSAILLTSAHAQNTTATPTNILGIKVVAPPPANFNPLTASPEANAYYAIPPCRIQRSHPEPITNG
jgi:hypothetical protein